MKQLFSLAIAVVLVTSCEGQQSKAMKDQQQALKALDKVSPGQIPTTEAGWMMKATINGKPWHDHQRLLPHQIIDHQTPENKKALRKRRASVM